MDGKVPYDKLKKALSRNESRERDALERMANASSFYPETELFLQREHLMKWFRDWREHIWRCYDAQ